LVLNQAFRKTGQTGLKSGPVFPLILRKLFQNFGFGTASYTSLYESKSIKFSDAFPAACRACWFLRQFLEVLYAKRDKLLALDLQAAGA
jgi:hypothetical protein